ncbi:tRNA preQ1(34) S-adenosylmethionine ribosyltransferase-isomerase QueA, partial [bacterium]
YIRRVEALGEDREWYQTLFADPDKAASAAAPTAGLHFTPRARDSLAEKGVSIETVTLHVGLGTFLPVRTDEVKDHKMHSELYEVTPRAAEAVNRALDEGRRVIAVGTTACRTLEHCGKSGRVEPSGGETDLFILPGHEFRVVKGLITNFHLPQSTLLMLVCAFGGRDLVLDAYKSAIDNRYRFYSYGDSMLLL